jgi:hypothetical protein
MWTWREPGGGWQWWANVPPNISANVEMFNMNKLRHASARAEYMNANATLTYS